MESLVNTFLEKGDWCPRTKEQELCLEYCSTHLEKQKQLCFFWKPGTGCTSAMLFYALLYLDKHPGQVVHFTCDAPSSLITTHLFILMKQFEKHGQKMGYLVETPPYGDDRERIIIREDKSILVIYNGYRFSRSEDPCPSLVIHDMKTPPIGIHFPDTLRMINVFQTYWIPKPTVFVCSKTMTKRVRLFFYLNKQFPFPSDLSRYVFTRLARKYGL
jgi:hypothetical protein